MLRKLEFNNQICGRAMNRKGIATIHGPYGPGSKNRAGKFLIKGTQTFLSLKELLAIYERVGGQKGLPKEKIFFQVRPKRRRRRRRRRK